MATQDNPLTFMAVHAHPDDEIFGTGGTFARLAAEGVRTVLVTATLGEEGEVVDPTLDEATKQAILQNLGEVREKELRTSVGTLNISELCLLGFRDSGMIGTPGNENPACFHRATFDEAMKRLVKLIRTYKPQVIASYDQFGGYGHPDHLQAHRITVAAFEVAGDPRFYPELELEPWKVSKLYFTVLPGKWFKEMAEDMRKLGIKGPWNNPEMDTDVWGVEDDMITTTFAVDDYLDAKMAAFQAHRTQISPDNFMFVIPADYRKERLGKEWFYLKENRVPGYAPEHEDHLFAGLK